ncbi:MAG: rhodanese-like domain-containing protein [Bacteroidetes bacterium]|nr:rhodanese-like domain-containing protein [Bacteroidota bacterium]
MKKILIISLTISILAISYAFYSGNLKKQKTMFEQKEYPKALVSYTDFKGLVKDIEQHRQERLINLDAFLTMSKEKNVVVLDSRSDFRYNRKHLKGAIHLSFTDFTQENLWKLIPDANTKILIYCNNNFDGDQIDFASKMAMPKVPEETQILSNRKPIMLALNIPTYINLFGYGYKNVYELDELVNINDKRITFVGTEVK